MKRRKRLQTKHVLLILTLVCSLTIILTIGTREKISPVEQGISYIVVPMQKGITSLGNWLGDKVEFVKKIKDLEDENKYLKERVIELEESEKISQIEQYELNRLREMYDLDQTYADYPKVAARVIGKDPGNWYNIFQIDKGSKDGIEVGMNVIAGNGLVGIVIETGETHSKVLTIIDDTSSVSAKFLRTSDLAIVKGDLTLIEDGYLKVEDIDKNAKIVEGDQVVTSHISSKYLQNILIGTVVEIKDEPNNLTKTAILEPAVDFRYLQEVLVITEKLDK